MSPPLALASSMPRPYQLPGLAEPEPEPADSRPLRPLLRVAALGLALAAAALPEPAPEPPPVPERRPVGPRGQA
jgi:hypothetical protein